MEKMKKYLIISVIIYFFMWFWLDVLNYLNWSDELPKEISQVYNEKEYASTTEYIKDKFVLWMVANLVIWILLLLALIFDWFLKLDNLISKKIKKVLVQWVLFFIVLNIIYQIIDFPFSYYYNFVIEEKFWFNNMSLSIFILDSLKFILISSVFIWFYIGWFMKSYIKQKEFDVKKKKIPRKYIIYSYLFMVWFLTFIMVFWSSIIIPLFNELKPIKDWELKQEISEVAKKENIDLEWIYVIDWSKRSSKANAFFTWFWPTKKIVLYDTLINDFTKEEIIAVLYHEIWHYKLHHMIYNLIILLLILTLFFILWIKYENNKNDWISWKIFFKNNSIQIWILHMLIMSLPIFVIYWIWWNSISRHFEYQSDNYSIERYNPEAMKNALIRLSKTTKSNVSPHPLYEIFYYSHPSILKRLKNINKKK
jgi:STE24 endopeptidase